MSGGVFGPLISLVPALGKAIGQGVGGLLTTLLPGPTPEPMSPSEETAHGDASFATVADAERENAKGKIPILLGELPNSGGMLLNYTDNRHLLTVAPTRTGKGTCAIIPNLLLHRDLSILCIDPKGQNAAVTASQRAEFGLVYLLNPFNEHGLGTARFNPLASLKPQSPTLVADVAGLAEALIINDGKDAHWADSARELVRALILHLVMDCSSEATLPEMRRRLTLPYDMFRELIGKMAKSSEGFVAQSSARFLHDTNEIKNIISTAITQTAFLDDPAIAHVLGGNDFHMEEFKKQVMTLYVILPARYLAAYARFFRLLVVSAIDRLTAQVGGTRMLMMLDEFAQLGHLSAVENAFGLAAGYNVQIWPFIQDLNQLKDIYDTRWESFLANAGAIQVFTPNDMFTAQYFSNRAGNFTKAIVTRSEREISQEQANKGFQGISTGESFVGVPLMSPQQLLSMSQDRGIVFCSGRSNPFLLFREPYYADAVLARLAEPDPFHPVGTERRQHDIRRATAYLRRAQIYEGYGNRDLASEYYDEAIALDPNSSEAYELRSCFRVWDQVDGALADAQVAVRLDPQNRNAHLACGYAHQLKDDYDNAILFYSNALGIDPKSDWIYEMRAHACLLKGDYRSAISDCDKAIRLNPNCELGYLHRGMAHFRGGDHAIAMRDFESASKVGGREALALYARGLVKVKLGDEQGGKADLDAAKVRNADIANDFAGWYEPEVKSLTS